MEFNNINKEIVTKKKASKGKDQCEDLCEKSKAFKPKIAEQEALSDQLDADRTAKLNLIGNVLGDQVPIFKSEDDNAEIKKWGKVPDMEIDGKTLGKLHHHEIMNLIDMFDMERGQKVAGHRGYFLKGDGVMLNQALINFGISTLYNAEYTPLQPPYFMKSQIMTATCQLSDFEENLYQVEGTGEDADAHKLYLIATSE